MTINITGTIRGNGENIAKGKYPLFIGDYISEAELVSVKCDKDTNITSFCYSVDDEKIINMIRQQDKKMINSSVSFKDDDISTGS